MRDTFAADLSSGYLKNSLGVSSLFATWFLKFLSFSVFPSQHLNGITVRITIKMLIDTYG